MNQLNLPNYIPPSKWYEDENELKYYGSALNKIIDKECTHEMTAINIDLIMQKISHKRLRLIESKNKNESMNPGQRNLFYIFLPNVFDFLNKISKPLFINYKFEVFLITGTYPYNDMTEILDLISKKIKFVNKDELIKFLNFELEFEMIKINKGML